MRTYCEVTNISEYSLGKVVALINKNTDSSYQIIYRLESYMNTKTILGHIIGFGMNDVDDSISIKVQWADGEPTFVPPSHILIL